LWAWSFTNVLSGKDGWATKIRTALVIHLEKIPPPTKKGRGKASKRTPLIKNCKSKGKGETREADVRGGIPKEIPFLEEKNLASTIL